MTAAAQPTLSMTVVDGKPAVEIDDHRGGVHAYRWSVLRDTPRFWSCRMAKLVPDDEGHLVEQEPYTVGIGEGWSSCTCLDAQCRKRVCKHQRQGRALRAFLAAMRAGG